MKQRPEARREVRQAVRTRELESAAVRFRTATVTATDPLTIAIGGSGEIAGVAALPGAVCAVDDVVGVLRWEGDALVLGVLELETTAWQDLTLEANWFGSIKYRRLADALEIKGAALRGSGTNNLVGTLPAGFRPVGDMYPTAYPGVLKIQTNGQLRFYDGPGGTSQTGGRADGVRIPLT